jgi:hypothetical protein
MKRRRRVGSLLELVREGVGKKKKKMKRTRPVTSDSVGQGWQFADSVCIGACLEIAKNIMLAFDNGKVW